jgi:DNA-directed RNA polymerase specialized sigma24 family protein
VDWVRSRAGRRRLFDAIERLEELDQQVFELYYWERHRATEIAEILSSARRQRVSPADVLDALARIENALSERQRSRLLDMMTRTRHPVALDSGADGAPLAIADRSLDPEAALRVKRLDVAFGQAMGELQPEDAAIVRMLFVHGWTLDRVRQALHLPTLTRERLQGILGRLRTALAARGVDASEASTPGLAFFEDDAT